MTRCGAAAALLGVAVLALEHAPPPYTDVSRLGGPWLVMAFLCGRTAGRVAAGAVAGAAALTVTNVSYYATKRIWGSPVNPAAFDDRTFWLAIGWIVGAVFGAIGAASLVDGPMARVATAGTLAGTVASEAFWVLGDPRLRIGVILVALALALLPARSRAEHVAAVLVAAGVCALVLATLDTLLVALRFNG